MNEDVRLIELCDVANVQPDSPFKADLEGIEVAVFQIGDQYYVTQDICTHGPGSLSEGYVDGAEVECPFHQGKFDIITGQPTAAPCTEPLRTWQVAVHNGKICATTRQACTRQSG